ncbi:LysR family transcriptional regulator [Bacillus thuringiensis]|uniref:LysR family transcriptional regulator n=1 Tax=Bacillus thuringiensis TaxID=1428 RepID=UPI002DBE208F|nr:LysR family transcriptional regulator [Bacillus thuringiensis]MEC3267996.1 LysR family transcriptional regulator [Bacillus thuringiensis]MED2072801.1 LysR family transcriptional regulator [Bacillus thuringiensis]MED2223798.1 LysR family transcriptional regulator [Bacillus thuringiensis]MED2282051.1 LysR family transcriptional regulator [Bacillus thuringiensis]MED2634921.1 LysR family transcriptional regulator [Bacillus thuringiensis]
MELRHLVTFKTIVEKGTFKKAADQLGYAQSSVTNHIKELEGELNQPLFDRLGKQVTLTTFGKQFFPYAIKIMDLYKEIIEKANRNDVPTGSLTIGASEALTSCRLPQILLEYKQMYPEVNLSIISIDNKNVTAELQQGNIDLALVLKKNNWETKDLQVEKIKQEQMVLITPLKDKQKCISNTVLYIERTCAYKSIFDDYIKDHYIEVEGSVDFGSIEPIKQCVMNGLGISMLPYFTVKKELENEQFNGKIVKDEQYGVSSFVTYHKDKWVSPAMESMISLIHTCSKEWD